MEEDLTRWMYSLRGRGPGEAGEEGVVGQPEARLGAGAAVGAPSPGSLLLSDARLLSN